MRKEIVDMYDDQRAVVDLLTQNMVQLQESNVQLRQELHERVESSKAEHECLRKEFNDLEARFNVAYFNSGGGGARVARKPFGDLTNSVVTPVWTDAEQE